VQENALNTSITVAAMAGNGTDFLELNEAPGSLAQTIGISRRCHWSADSLGLVRML
jgi:hypothetical protein